MIRPWALGVVSALVLSVGPLAHAQNAPAKPAQKPAAPAQPAVKLAETAKSGKSLVVPEDQKAKGTVYSALPGMDRQVFFTSTAPVETIEGQSNAVIGYVVAGKEPGSLVAGEWHLPVDSMRTGIPARDKHLTQETWLDAGKNPRIAFRLKEFKDATVTKEAAGLKTYTGTLVGDMTIKGVTKPMEIKEATVTFLAAGPESAKVAKGELLAIRAKYDIKLEDFGVSNEVITTRKKVAEVVQVETALYMSTVPPEEQSAK